MAAIDMSNCLMLISKVGRFTDQTKRVFACKTCNREFPSFQALGGHRASHKKPRLMAGAGAVDSDFSDQTQMPDSPKKKAKTHECSICGLEFAIGQALGGHMRRHRGSEAIGGGELVTRSLLSPVPVLKKSNSKRVMCLDLNLMPNGDDLKLWVN